MAYIIDIGPDPTTGKRRQRWKGNFGTEREAEQAMRSALGRIDKGEAIDETKMTLREYLVEPVATESEVEDPGIDVGQLPRCAGGTRDPPHRWPQARRGHT